MSEKDRIIVIFEAHRKEPGASYDPDHFLDYLLAQPKRKYAVYNSFTGLRRFNAFVDQVQLEYSVYLSQKDRESNYNLDRFVARILELRSSPRSSLASLRNYMKKFIEWHLIFLSNIFLAVPAFAFRESAVFWLLISCIVIVNCFWFWFYRRDAKYCTRLRQQLLAVAEARPNSSFKPKPPRGSA